MCQSICFVINNDGFVDQWIHVSVNVLIGTIQVPLAYLKNLHYVSDGPPATISDHFLMSCQQKTLLQESNKIRLNKGKEGIVVLEINAR